MKLSALSELGQRTTDPPVAWLMTMTLVHGELLCAGTMQIVALSLAANSFDAPRGCGNASAAPIRPRAVRC